MTEAYIVDAIPLPGGDRHSSTPPILVPASRPARTHGRDPDAVEDVIFGNVDSVGGQAGDIALDLGWRPVCRSTSPASPSTASVDQGSRRCRSPPRASPACTTLSSRWRAADVTDPDLLRHDPRRRSRLRRSVQRFGGVGRSVRDPGSPPVPGREMIAEKWDISREQMEAPPRKPRTSHPGHRRGPLRQRDRPRGRLHDG